MQLAYLLLPYLPAAAVTTILLPLPRAQLLPLRKLQPLQADYAALNGVEASTLEITYAFDGNGKATCTGLGTTVEGTYTVDGTTVKTAFEGSSPEFTYSAENETLSVTDAATGVTTVMAKNA